MAQASSPSRPPAQDSGDSALATVRLEVRSGLGRATTYEVGDGGFLIGSVPGCDLRLPGANLPPIICVIGRSCDAAYLRRLAPVLPILVNGEAVAAASLKDGDTLRIGPIEIVLSVQPANQARPLPSEEPGTNGLDEREQKLKDQIEQLENDSCRGIATARRLRQNGGNELMLATARAGIGVRALRDGNAEESDRDGRRG